MTLITHTEVEMFHQACKMIEADGLEAYWSVRHRYGENIANAIVIFWLRAELNDKPDQYPPPEDLPDKVNKVLVDKGLLREQQ